MLLFMLSLFMLTVCGLDQENCSVHDLYNMLNSNLSVTVRPTTHWENATEVHVDITLYSIIRMDMTLQSISTYIWFEMSWRNKLIFWKPEEYCEIKSIIVPESQFWKPELYISELTKLDENPMISYYQVNHDGLIVQTKPLRIVSTCNLDIFKFPFDTQTCNLTFTTFVYQGWSMILVCQHGAFSYIDDSSSPSRRHSGSGLSGLLPLGGSTSIMRC
ncbi:5-hydroxytryptamine receptor 3A-like [Pelobates fuscus]|uniref:5-hydroxytryptamine receptor 3A-like n=1 Tax=Pelobates fuscus TaxID=191477 RepID=UPI002FE4F556